MNRIKLLSVEFYFSYSPTHNSVITTVLIWTRVFLTDSVDNGPMARAGHSVCGMGAVTARARLITKTTVSILFPLLASLIVRKLVSDPGSLHLNLR